MLYIGGLIVILTFVAIIKKCETRLCLLIGGVAMAVIAMKPMMAVDSFVKAMTSILVPTVCAIMGFAAVMQVTHCGEHLVKALTKLLQKVPVLLIPGTVIVTFLINISLVSAAGCCAAVGSFLIPTLIKIGVHPTMAASIVFAGAFGSVLHPGAHNALIAKLAVDAYNTDFTAMDGVMAHAPQTFIALIFVAIGVTITAKFLKEDRGYVLETVNQTGHNDEDFKVNILMAIAPIFPLILLLLASKPLEIIPSAFQSIPMDMLIGTVLGALITKSDLGEIVKSFWKGAGSGYGNIIGLIICATVFAAGMSAIGLTGALIEVMKHSQSIAKIAGAFGSFIIAMISGSGDATTFAFNGAIAVHAPDFGLNVLQLGSISLVGGALGRGCSPVAAACIICAGLAGVSPMDIAKRNFLIMFLACCLITVIM